MRWLNPNEAQASAFSAPDAQALAFRLPGHLTQDRVHLLARAAFGHRAQVGRSNGSWVVQRRPFLEALVRSRLEKECRREQQRLIRRCSPKNARPSLHGGL